MNHTLLGLLHGGLGRKPELFLDTSWAGKGHDDIRLKIWRTAIAVHVYINPSVKRYYL